MERQIKILGEICVNSKWKASWLADNNIEYCQCGFECKIKVNVTRNGNSHNYILTEKEYISLIKQPYK